MSSAEESPKSARARSRGFPILDLGRAVEAVRAAGRYGLVHSRSAFAAYLGHQTPDSGPFKQKLAALRDFGLVDSSGQIRLSDLGARLALPEDERQEAADRLEAFFNADTFAELFANSAKGIALDDERLAASAVHNLGVSAASRRQFADSFIESAIFAGVASRPGVGRVVLDDAPDRPSGRAIDESTEPDARRSSPAPRPATRNAPDDDYPTDFVISHDLGDGDVTFRLRMGRPISGSLFGQVQDVVSAIERLANAARVTPATNPGISAIDGDAAPD